MIKAKENLSFEYVWYHRDDRRAFCALKDNPNSEMLAILKPTGNNVGCLGFALQF